VNKWWCDDFEVLHGWSLGLPATGSIQVGNYPGRCCGSSLRSRTTACRSRRARLSTPLPMRRWVRDEWILGPPLWLVVDSSH
jgi:hypothetical protein